MVKMKVSYECIEELCKVIMLLGDAAEHIRLLPCREGEGRRADIDLVDLERAEIIRDR